MRNKSHSGIWAAKVLGALVLTLAVGIAGCSRDDAERVTQSPQQAPGDEAVAGPKEPEVREITDAEAEQAATDIFREVRLDLADGLKGELWSSDALLGDPVAISV